MRVEHLTCVSSRLVSRHKCRIKVLRDDDKRKMKKRAKYTKQPCISLVTELPVILSYSILVFQEKRFFQVSLAAAASSMNRATRSLIVSCLQFICPMLQITF